MSIRWFYRQLSHATSDEYACGRASVSANAISKYIENGIIDLEVDGFYSVVTFVRHLKLAFEKTVLKLHVVHHVQPAIPTNIIERLGCQLS